MLGWSLQQYATPLGGQQRVYLARRYTVPAHSLASSSGSLDETSRLVDAAEDEFGDMGELVSEDVDGSTLHSDLGDAHEIVINAQVIHSASYQVPVLYLTPQWRHSGMPITDTELYQHVIRRDTDRAALESVPFGGGITMSENPLTGTPCYSFHPCNTATLMESIVDPALSREDVLKRYIASWISIYGAPIGLTVPLSWLTTLNEV
ncbi:hypothetical protein GQ42DRAFT_154578 [Ramicandelaber brevisporus]|nr:hypothetical protein GQ42DRAFT_154578 [Ramicandelaber brevisporus]